MSTLKVGGIRGTGASEDAITVNATDGTCTAKVTNRSNRNLIINGAMNVAQRGGASSTTAGTFVPDRWRFYATGGTTTLSWETLSSGTPYDLAFRKYSRLTNTANSTAANSYRVLRYRPEAQDIATSGWNYTSASSYVTLSFWIRSSIAQTFYVALHTSDGTEKHYLMSTGALSADTWTKVTKTIPGGTGVQFDNDSGAGAKIDFIPYWGTDYQGSISTETWVTYSGSARVPTGMANTWAGTNGATFDVTGVQLELGDTATDFEHRSYGDELARCERYYQNSYQTGSIPGTNNALTNSCNVLSWADGNAMGVLFRTRMRSSPTVTLRTSGSTTTGQVDSAGTARAATAQNIGHTQWQYLAITSGSATNWVNLCFEAAAEL
jgi:hypothetical protein